MITVPYIGLYLASGLVVIVLSLPTCFEEGNCHESYNPRKLNTASHHLNREVGASLVEPSDENPAPVITLMAASRDPK